MRRIIVTCTAAAALTHAAVMVLDGDGALIASSDKPGRSRRDMSAEPAGVESPDDPAVILRDLPQQERGEFLRQYHEAIDELNVAQKLMPDDDMVYAWLARSWSQLDDQQQTLRYVQLAEQHAMLKPAAASASRSDAPEIFLFTGEALNHLGDQNAAMDRYRRALTMPGSDRVGVRLAIAQTMAQKAHDEDASRQIALALMEAEAKVEIEATAVLPQ